MIWVAFCLSMLCAVGYAAYWQHEAIVARREADRMEHYRSIAQAKMVQVVTDPNCPKDAVYLFLGLEENK